LDAAWVGNRVITSAGLASPNLFSRARLMPPHPTLCFLSVDEKSFVRRIPYLASLRNKLLEPLQEFQVVGRKFDKVIFFNDVVFRFHDILELLYTKSLNYDAVCGMDYYYQFYDLFATRDIEGKPFGSGLFPYAEHRPTQKLFYHDEPVPVQSCWNGVAIYNAEVFRQGVLFRALDPEKELVENEASECCLINIDIREKGFSSIFINPKVKVWLLVASLCLPFFFVLTSFLSLSLALFIHRSRIPGSTTTSSES